MTDRTAYLKRKYGITQADYDTALVQQAGRCAICSKFSPRRALEVDHDHVTGAWSGSLICHRCNEGLGRYEFDLDVLRAAANYMQGIIDRREKWLTSNTHR